MTTKKAKGLIDEQLEASAQLLTIMQEQRRLDRDFLDKLRREEDELRRQRALREQALFGPSQPPRRSS